MGDVTIHLLLDSALRRGDVTADDDEHHGDDGDLSSSPFRFRGLSRVLPADSSLSELMDVVLSEIDIVARTETTEMAGTVFKTTTREMLLEGLVVIDASYHPPRDISSTVRRLTGTAGPACATLQSLGWYPSGRLVVLPADGGDASSSSSSLARFVEWSSRNAHFRDEFEYNDPNAHRRGGPSPDAASAARTTTSMKPSEILDAASRMSNASRSNGSAIASSSSAHPSVAAKCEELPRRRPDRLATAKFILLLGVDKGLFTACFGQDDAWPCELRMLDETCSADEAHAEMSDPDILCCVVQDDETHWNLVKSHYYEGGFVVYFGIYGVYNDPVKLSRAFGVQWEFAAYTKHEHRLTPIGIRWLGDGVTEQQYTKSNMLSVPVEDRIVIGKAMTWEEYSGEDNLGFDASVGVDNLDDDDRKEYEAARDVHYPRHCEEMENHASLAMHVDPSHGGKIAYLGFVNDDGNIPKFVRALLTGEKNRKSIPDSAISDISNTDLIVDDVPSVALAARLSRDCIECDNPRCSKPGPAKRCANCNTTYYCDATCQRAHWQEHRPDCRNVQTMRDGITGIGVVDIPAEFSVPSDDDAEKNRRAIHLATRARNASGLNDEERVKCRHMALAELEQVVSSDEPLIWIQMLVTKGEVLRQLGRHADAINTMSEIITLIEDGINAKAERDSLMEQLDAAIAMGMDDCADAIAEMMDPLVKKAKYASTGHTIIEAHLDIAETMEEIGDWDDALKIYIDKVMAVLEYSSDDLPLNFNAVHQRRMYMGMSRCFYHKGDYAKAICAGENAIEMNRHFPQVHKYVALSQRAIGNIKLALRIMLRAVHYETPWDDSNKKEVLEMYVSMKRDAELSIADRTLENASEGIEAKSPYRLHTQMESFQSNYDINVDDGAEEKESECVPFKRPENIDDEFEEVEEEEEKEEQEQEWEQEQEREQERETKNKKKFSGIYHDKCRVDEFGRTFCAAHRRQECHICGMSFSMMNEEIDQNPSKRDVGVFIPESEIVDWHEKMKIRMPQVFSMDEQTFGDDSGQHRYGTKLYFDDDPRKNCTVIGSRWQKEEARFYIPGLSPFAENKEPHYVVLVNGELDQIGFFDAHMIDYGWRVVGWDPKVHPRFDLLARSHRDIQNAKSSKEGERIGKEASDGSEKSTLQSLNCRIRRTLKWLHDNDHHCELPPWDQSVNGNFFRQFFTHCFSPSERDRIIVSIPELDTGGGAIAEKIKAYPLPEHLLRHETNFYVRLVLAKIVAYHAHDNYGGVIICNKRGTKFQAIEFNNNHASHDLVPCVDITYATDPEGIEGPTLYLRGETIKRVDVSNELAVVLENHLLDCVSNNGRGNDVGSGLLFHQGVIAPMEIIPWDAGKVTSPICATNSIPVVNFGVELEVSCASGNYMQRTALALETHAQVKVRIQMHNGKGGKSGKGGKGGKGGGLSGKAAGKTSHNTDEWKLVFDESIEPNAQNPRSAMFELVSPILSGTIGLETLSNTVSVMSDVTCVRVNESMGLHVHVEAKEENFSLANVKSICQQFLLYENVMDSFFPYHRRTGSEKCHSYFESNLIALMERHANPLNAIFSCRTRKDLYELINPNIFRQRYHKLNLQNLATGRQPTIEFRQHHSTKDEVEIVAWVRFCVLFVTSAARLPPLDNLSQIDHVKEHEGVTFNQLFDTIIKCPTLREYYSKKRMEYDCGAVPACTSEYSHPKNETKLLPTNQTRRIRRNRKKHKRRSKKLATQKT